MHFISMQMSGLVFIFRFSGCARVKKQVNGMEGRRQGMEMTFRMKDKDIASVLSVHSRATELTAWHRTSSTASTPHMSQSNFQLSYINNLPRLCTVLNLNANLKFK